MTIQKANPVLGRLQRVMWSGGNSVAFGSMLAAGAVVWGAYSVAYLLVKGVILDEVLVPAEIITGAVQYPPGHPHEIFYVQAYALFNYLAAALWAAVPNPWVISAIRNFLFLFLSMLVPFALTLLLTRRPAWGYVASSLTASEAALRFAGVYPMWVFPGAFSTGHISIHVVLLIVVLLLAGWWRFGGFLLGLLVSLHPAMAIAVWLWSAGYLLLSGMWRRNRDRLRLGLGVGLGLAISAALAVIIFVRTVSAAANTTYENSTANGQLVHQQFIALTDTHRQLFIPFSRPYFLNPAAFFIIGAFLWWNMRQSPVDASTPTVKQVRWILLLGLVTWVYVYGAWLWQSILGTLPTLIELSMPFRMSNLTALVLIPLSITAVAFAHQAMDEDARHVGMLLLIILVSAAGILSLANRLSVYKNLMFVTWGAVFAMDLYAHWRQPTRRFAVVLAVAILGGISALLPQLTREAGFLLSSFLVSLAAIAGGAKLLRGRHRYWKPGMSGLELGLLCACAASCLASAGAVSVWDQFNSTYSVSGQRVARWDEVSAYDQALNRWLAANARRDEMILPAIYPRTELQGKTGHPVLMESETLWLMSYMPSLAPTIGTMARDLYGVDYADQAQLQSLAGEGQLLIDAPVWLAAWHQRTLAEWQRLGHKYDFRLVLSPTNTPLNLNPTLIGPLWTLYLIPS